MHNINLFINGTNFNDLRLNTLSATSGTGNAGIDFKEVISMARIKFTPLIMHTSPEKGHTDHNPSATNGKYSCGLYFPLEAYVSLYQQIITLVEGVTMLYRMSN